MESHLEATVNGSCVHQRDRIIESFIGVIGDLMVSYSLCPVRHRCRIRNTYVYCSNDATPPPSTAGDPSFTPAENVTVDFVLENELKRNSRPVTQSDQLDLVHSLDDVFAVLYDLVTDEELTWSTQDSLVVAVSLDSALVQFDMDNCSDGQTLNDRNSDVPTCRKYLTLPAAYSEAVLAANAQCYCPRGKM